MAKKPRTPAPPRKVQAPKTRANPRTPGESRRFRILIGVAAAGLIGLAVALALVLSSSGGSSNTDAVGAVMRNAGCTYATVTSTRAAEHIDSLSDKVTYNSYPPTSGRHYNGPAIWNNYTRPVNPKQAVHNEEHGGMVVWYGPKTSAEDRQKINEFYDESPNGIIVTPLDDSTTGITYPKHQPLGSKIALTAWVAPNGAGKGVVAICPSVDLEAFRKFRDSFRGKGPERFPVSANQPGT